jgi:hypothetical protein
VVASLWPECRAHEEAAQLLLRIVRLGSLKECAALAAEAAFDASLGSATRVFAGWALIATASENAKKQYANFIVAERSSLPDEMVRDAITELFPGLIGIGDLLDILESIDVAAENVGLGFAWEGPRLVEKLDSASDLEHLLGGLLLQLGGELDERSHDEPTKREEAYFPAIVTAAVRLLKLSSPEVTPTVAVDALLRVRVANRRNQDIEIKSKLGAAFAELHRTASRRRFAFWRAAQYLRGPHESRRIEQLWQLEFLGWRAGLEFQDVEWLLQDGLTKGQDDRRLAINSALALQGSPSAPAGLIERIAAAANTDAVAVESYQAWMRQQQVLDARPEMDRVIENNLSLRASEKEEREQSWVAFIRELREDSARIARLKTPPTSGVNPELLQLCRLLHGASTGSRYAIDNVGPLVKITGTQAAEAVRQGLIAHWRNSAPQLGSQKDVMDRNTVRWEDLMGLAGVSLEAASDDAWAHKLSGHEATLAAGYATLELNGFPSWLARLAASNPGEVRTVLLGEISAELSRLDLAHYATLIKVANGDDGVAALVAPALLEDMEPRVHLANCRQTP